MKSNIIDGKKISGEILADLKKKVAAIKGRKPGLAAILVGDNPASRIYIKKKVAACKKVGIISRKLELSEEFSEKELLKIIESLNQDDSVDGILVQLPLPEHINEFKVINAILPEKDVDGFHPLNIGNLKLGNEIFAPCTPKGVVRLLKHCKIDVAGKDVVIVGASNIVGKPLAVMLLNRDATITVCHKYTKDLKEETRKADILAVGVGRPGLITEDMVKEGVVVFDIGINRVDGEVHGDVDFKNVKKKAALITPVPGGVGPMTVAMLMENTLLAYEHRNLKKEVWSK